MDPKTQKEKRRSPVSQHAVWRERIKQAGTNRLSFRVVLFDVWCASAETLVFLTQPQHRDFICPLKTTRQVALSKADKPQGRYVRVDTRELEAQAPREIYREGGDFPLVLVKQVFTNEEGSSGIRSLVSRATPLSVDDLTTPSPKRGQGECYPNSLKQNVSLAKSPPQTEATQTNHFFAPLCGFLKGERVKGKTELHHLALKSNLYLHALPAAFSPLRTFTTGQVTA